jgi:hypothetical protein
MYSVALFAVVFVHGGEAMEDDRYEYLVMMDTISLRENAPSLPLSLTKTQNYQDEYNFYNNS